MIPLDMYFSLFEDTTGASGGNLEIQVDQYGNVTSVYVGGTRIKGAVSVCEFVELLIGQDFLAHRASQMTSENDPFSANKSAVESEMMQDTQKRDVI